MIKFLVQSGACIFATTFSDHETAAEKCEEDEENFDGCSQYLYGNIFIVDGKIKLTLFCLHKAFKINWASQTMEWCMLFMIIKHAITMSYRSRTEMLYKFFAKATKKKKNGGGHVVPIEKDTLPVISLE